MTDILDLPRAALDAWRGEAIRLSGTRVHVPGPRRIRFSVLAGNLRIHRLLDRLVMQGATVLDVGANIGYNTVHAARRAGRRGRVVAIEPTPDNLEILRRNVAASGLTNIAVEPVAVGSATAVRDLFVRGERSAVNSFYPDSCYAQVTEVLQVPVVPLDELASDGADVVKIDVEGAELDVLEGMPRTLRGARTALIVEWHPLLQQMAGYAPDSLPRWLLERGWQLLAASHWSVRPLVEADVAALTSRLMRTRGPVELLAQRRASARS